MYSVVLLMALSGSAETPAAYRCNGCDCGGCYGCRGGGGRRFGCRGCTGCDCGGCSGCRGGFFRRSGCRGCNGGYSCNGGYGCYGCSGCYGPAAAPVTPVKPAERMPAPKQREEARSAAPATIVVSLPADATLRVDDYTTVSKSASRVFVSPTLDAGKEYYYTLTGEIQRDGKPVVATKQISIRAGEETRVVLEFPVAAVASK